MLLGEHGISVAAIERENTNVHRTFDDRAQQSAGAQCGLFSLLQHVAHPGQFVGAY